MKKIFQIVILLLLSSGLSLPVFAAYESRFDAINFEPAVDGGDYFTVYGSDTLAASQGHLGFYLDYANRPLEFSGTGGFAGTRQSVIDHMVVMNNFGAIGLTNWFTVGLNIPVVGYSWFYSDEPVAAPSGTADKAAMMGDLEVMMKFRILDINEHKVGLALVPHFTLPTGDVVRYAGSGHVTGGGTFVTEFQLHERFNMALNVGAVLRDNVLRHGVDMDHQLTAGLAANIKLSRYWQAIVESYGSTGLTDFFNSATTPLEAGGGVRYYFGDSGFALDAGGTAGLIDGVGSPSFRGFFGLKYTTPVKENCAPAPDPRIQGNKIVLFGKIFYDTNKATIKPVSYPVLDDVADVLNKHPEITLVEVQGHTDARASDAYNLKLSQARAESAMNYLVGKGIVASRLRAMGYGESHPIASNDTVEGMSQNRRTEFIIISSTSGEYTSEKTTQAPVSSEPVVTTAPQAVPASTPSAPSSANVTEYPNYSYPAPTN